MNSLEINWKRFAETKDCELSNLNEKLEVLFMDISAKNTFYYHGDYSVKMADLFIEINNFSSQNFLINFFMEGSAYQILTLQILQYMDDLAHLGHKKVLRKSEIGQIEKAASIINNDIQDFSTVNKLASDVGLNPNKLQEGFKELYDTTVNNYLHNRRLDLATNLLKNTEMSISEIVFKLGLSSKSYFSKIIKERYGISPSTLRKKRSE